MSVPDHSHIVRDVFNRGNVDLTSPPGCGVFTEAVVLALHQLDPQWGHLKKTPGHNQYNGHAVDAALYRSLGTSVDFIANSATHDAHLAWTVDVPRYSEADWYAPVGVVPPPVDPDVPSREILAQRVDELTAQVALQTAEIQTLQATVDRYQAENRKAFNDAVKALIPLLKPKKKE